MPKFNSQIFNIWKYLQCIEHENFKKSPIGVFSTNGCNGAIKIGDLLRNNIKGKCLDVGCGLLIEPVYMKNQPDIQFYGIDPFEDKISRKFRFVCGIGEYLPFKNEFFDCVLFATTIDHMISPQMAVNEAYRVLKYNGYIIIWFKERTNIYTHYDGSRDSNHQWGFTDKALIHILRSAQFNNAITLQKTTSNSFEHVITTLK